jgi:SAM-dependent methyltransferase
MNLLTHYRKLWFFNFNRLKGDNYARMREYFAGIFISEIEEFTPLLNKKVLDVGGARGEFCKVLNELRHCAAYNLDPAPYEYGQYKSDFIWPNTQVGTAEKMPFADNEFDLVICRGVLEHIHPKKQQGSLNEMSRVTRSGGFVYLAIPPWFNPFAGHGLKPFHYFPFKIAKFLAEACYGKKIKASSWDEKRLYSITFARMLRMIKNTGLKLLATKDTHLRLHFLTRIPLAREILVPSVAFILRKD